jgi:hypothetical protein
MIWLPLGAKRNRMALASFNFEMRKRPTDRPHFVAHAHSLRCSENSSVLTLKHSFTNLRARASGREQEY